MVFSFYINTSTSNVLDKTIEPILDMQAIDCTIKAPLDPLNPVIVLDYKDRGANYVYSPDTNKYYFVDPPERLSGCRMVCRLHVDVLMTHKKTIRNLAPIVKRSESLVNSYLNDNNLPVQANQEPDAVAFPSSPLLTSQQFILITAGGVE